MKRERPSGGFGSAPGLKKEDATFHEVAMNLTPSQEGVALRYAQERALKQSERLAEALCTQGDTHRALVIFSFLLSSAPSHPRSAHWRERLHYIGS